MKLSYANAISVCLKKPQLRLTVIATVAMLASLMAVPTALAQGTYGAMPDPISQRELARYADRLQLTDAQRQGLDQIHAAYGETFRELRESDIEEFMTDVTSRGMQLMTNPDLLKKTLSRYQRINNQIEAMDIALFEELQQLLSDEQLLLLERVLMARQRIRSQAASTLLLRQMNPAAAVDFSTMYDEMMLTPDVLATADPVMQDYEERLTQGTTRLHEYVVRLPAKLIDELEKMGYTTESISDPSMRGQLFQDFRTVWGDLEVELVKKSFQVSDLNRNALTQFRTVLSDDQVDKLWRDYLKSGYQSANPAAGSVSRYFDAALTLDGLSQAKRDMIAMEAMELKDRVNALTQKMVDAIDGDRKNTRMMDRWGRNNENEYRTRLGVLREQLTELREQALASLELILGQNDMQQVKAQLLAGQSTQTASTETGSDRRRGPRSWRSTSGSKGVTARWLSPPISQTELERLMARLNLPESENELVNDLYNDYRDQYQDLLDGDLAQADEVQKTLWALNLEEDKDVTPPSRSDLDDAFSLRSSAIAQLAELDQSFLNNVSLMFVPEGSPLLQRLIDDRTRSRCISMRAGHLDFIPTWIIGMEDTDEPSIDLVDVVYSSELSRDELISLDAILMEYEQLATAAFVRAHEDGLAFENAVGGVMIDAAMEENQRSSWRRFRNIDADSMRASQAVLMQLNRQSLQIVLSELTPGSSSRVKNTYNRQGFGVVYEDKNAAADVLQQALSLPDLTATQRQRIVDISLDYRAKYEELSGQLVDMAIVATDPSKEEADDRNWRSRMQTERSREQIEFERDELSERTRNQIRLVLQDNQIAQLSGIEPTQSR